MNTSTSLSTDRQKGQALLKVLLIVAAVGGYLIYSGKINLPQNTSQQTTQQASSSAEMANWKTYTNTEAKVSFQYPSAWTIKEEKPSEDYKRISIQGKEGQILIDYGGGFGGACPSGWEEFKIGTTQNRACHAIQDDGSENWELEGFTKNNINYSGFVMANSPYKDHRELILKILSTFKFLDQADVEGKFCGGIAANLPENKCPEGYKCQLDGNYPDAGGKCIKK